MFQIRLHGRGGQGVVTSAEMLSVAGFAEGHYTQAFPNFGSERTGAPVVSFARFNHKPIRLREPIMEPDAVLIQDRTLLESINVFGGLSPEGYVLINTAHPPEKIGLSDLVKKLPKGHVITLPATAMAIKHLKKPLTGAPILAGFAALTGKLKLESIQEAFHMKYKGKVAEANALVAEEAYHYVCTVKKKLEEA